MYELKDYLRPPFVKLAVPAVFLLLWSIVGLIYGEPLTGILVGLLVLLILIPVLLPWIRYWSNLIKLNTGHSSEWKEEIEKNFRNSKGFIYDRIRIGEKYIFINKEGLILPREDINGFDYKLRRGKSGWYWALGFIGAYDSFTKLSELSSEISENDLKNHVFEANAYLMESGS